MGRINLEKHTIILATRAILIFILINLFCRDLKNMDRKTDRILLSSSQNSEYPTAGNVIQNTYECNEILNRDFSIFDRFRPVSFFSDEGCRSWTYKENQSHYTQKGQKEPLYMYIQKYILAIITFIAILLIKPVSSKHLLKPSSYFNFWGNEIKRRDRTIIHCFPASLKQYFSDLDRYGIDDKVKLMNHEWVRLSSFKTFPTSSNASSIRLAQSGFYYSGKDEEAVCFCCGLKNGKWNANESIHDVHKHLSPDCKFVRGLPTNNVPIHGNQVNENLSSGTEAACGGPEDILETPRETYSEPVVSGQRSDKKNTDNQTGAETQEITHDNIVQPTGSQNSIEQQAGERRNATEIVCSNTSRPNESQNAVKQKETETTRGAANLYPGISHEQPKHPEYSTRSARMVSYSGWPSSDIVTPEQLSDAGFFYAGILDCVRCFFCGCGIKHWEYGDSPTIEHERWYPNCAFVKQCREMANFQRRQTAEEVSTGRQTPETNTVEDLRIEDLNSDTAALVLGMGYSQSQVEEAIKHARVKYGQAKLRAQYLVECLLDHQSTAASYTAPKPQNFARNSEKDNSLGTNATHNVSEKDQNLSEENSQLREQMLCKICMDKEANVVFLPCGHLVSCVECGHTLRKCAVCRALIQRTVRTYR